MNGGQIPWNAVATCEMSKIFWKTGKLRTNEDLGNHLKYKLFHYRRESITGDLCRICFDRGRIWKGDILIADIEELENFDALEHLSKKVECKRSPENPQRRRICVLVADGSARSSARDDEFQEPTLRRESPKRRQNLSGESQGDREEFQP